MTRSVKTCLSLVCLALILFISGCDDDSGGLGDREDTVNVYRLLLDRELAGGALITPEEVSLPADADPVYFALKEVVGRPHSQGMGGAFPEDVQFLTYTVGEAELSVRLSSEYTELEGMEKSIADYCLCFTMCEMEGIDAVSIYVDGELITPGLTPDDVILYDSETNPYEKQLRLYYADSGGRYLSAEYHSLTPVDETTYLARHVVDELLRGPNGETLYSAIPQDTALVDIFTEEGICTVILSEEFLLNMPPTIQGQRLAVYSMVNSLTSLADIKTVRLEIQGDESGFYGHIPLDEPLERNETINGPPSPAKGEADIDVYYVTPDGKHLAAIPCVLAFDDEKSREEELLAFLMEGEGQPGFPDIFPEGLSLNRVSVRSGVCTVNMPKEFFDVHSRKGDLDISLESIAHSLLSLGNASRIQFRADGEVYTSRGKSYDGSHVKNAALVITIMK